MVVNNSSSPASPGSFHRRSSSTRDSSGGHPSSKARKRLDRSSSPKHASSRSRGSDLPVRDGDSSRKKSPNHRRSSSPAPRSSIWKSKPIRDRSPKVVKARSSLPISPAKNKPSSRRSPKHGNSRSSASPVITRSRSPMPRLPSPGSSKRDRTEQYTGEKNGKEYEKNLHKKRERSDYDDKDLVRGVPSERRDREPSGSGSRSSRRHASSPSDLNRRGRQRSTSPLIGDGEHNELQSPRGEDQRNDADDPLSKMKAVEAELEAKEKQKPSFELSGKLAAETNRVRGITLLFNEPPDARKPDIRWRLYVFKGGEPLNEPLYVHRQSCYLFGRERRVADIPTDHPSCSKQHAVLQFRQVEVENADGTMSKKVRPYLMDLGSTNGTFINENQVEPQRYYELLEKDTVKFGNSSREYVLLHENSTT